MNICAPCYNAVPRNLITKTTAIDKYILKSPDLTNVRHTGYINRYHKNTYLYLIKDIEYLANQKHGSVELMNEKINKKIEKAKEKLESKQKKIQDMIDEQNLRKKNLNDYLVDIGFGLMRDDSKLCWNYIAQGEDSGYTIEGIGNTLLEMKFLHEKTKYAEELKAKRAQEIKIMQETGTFTYWSDKDEENLRQRIKKDSLRKYVDSHFDEFDKIIVNVPKTIQHLAQKYHVEMIKKDKKLNSLEPSI